MHTRTQIAEAVLAEYQRLKREPLECLETSIVDLMTDLLHLAKREGLDRLALSRLTQMHFEAEAVRVA